MEICVAAPFRMYDRPSFLASGRVVCFQTEIESQQEVGEVHAQPHSVGCGDLFVEFIEFEFAARLILVVAYGPYVAGIDE